VWWDGRIHDRGPGRAVDVDDLGRVLGVSDGRLVLWQPWQRPQRIDLGVEGDPTALYRRGQVAVTIAGPDPAVPTQAAIWQWGRLSPLPPTDRFSVTRGMNGCGEIAGRVGTRAVVWRVPTAHWPAGTTLACPWLAPWNP
jgi:hypothetical protein